MREIPRAPRWLALTSLVFVAACAGGPDDEPPPRLHYVGSSTIAHYLRDAEAAHGGVHFLFDTEPESAGGEQAIIEGRADLAGVANEPRRELFELGIEGRVIGRDSIAVVVHASNPIEELSREELRRLFTGEVRNWKELGGPDLPVHCFIVSHASATRTVFRRAVLGAEEYVDCGVLAPDARVIAQVAGDVGAIAPISASFLERDIGVKAIAVDGERPDPTNEDYPICRPLYLLWWPGRARVEAFVDWTQSPEGRAVLLQRFSVPATAR